MKTLRRFVDRWLFEEYRTDAESLGLFRILFSSYVLLAELPRGLWVLPEAAFSPPVGIAALFTHYPPYWLMLLLNAAAMLSGCCLLLGLWTTASSFGLGIGTLLVNSFCYADGKIDEGLLLWVALLMAYSGWGARFSIDERRRRGAPEAPSRHQPWLLAVLAMVIGFALFTAGSAKARGGWLRPDSLGTRYHLFWDYYVFGRQTPLAGWAFRHLPSWAWKCADWPTVLWETGFVVSIFRRSWCRLACAFGAFFHFGVWLLFDIEISSNLIAYGAFVSWAYLWPAATRALRTGLQRMRPAAISALCAAPFGFSCFWLFVCSPELRDSVTLSLSKVLLSIGLGCALLYLRIRLRASLSSALAGN
jgi:uncharacterized membrane protein YphA (DoxX/SURF4 family)